MNKVGVKLKKERERKNYSQEYVAERMGVSTSTISRIESNCRNVKMGQIEDYCTILVQWKLLQLTVSPFNN